MKGGIVVLLTALRALHAAGQLALPLTVMLTGDEEDPAAPP
jgi:acetylornithine deacetylase/succinyl-diaminopimelate desuccinylase-like protein